ncbi:LOW QUALITY PROTEIN: hypothetical protein BC936DRAFT_148531 [Jimgerdemannia flammicorona]|uniref:Uncharacterized protein n=1 Tax=Jimgerdemannia flammicorona TaxID=994334 RepID=A0A433D2W6_9FUNG|nr:LOW QUALITY PROTEIN: hypothetical protein BC936DRAFT_148531 [Jimgerdemannia flammicorona]
MIIELDCPEGYVCRVHRGEVFKVADVNEQIYSALTAVKECLEKVLTHANGAEEVLMLVRNAGVSHESDVDTLQVPCCLQTPVKRSKKV